MTFHNRLISELTQSDTRASRRKYHNPNALGLYFEAAEKVQADIAAGVTPARSFSERFTPIGPMLTVAKKLGLNLEIKGSFWNVTDA